MRVSWAAASHPGLQRPTNEDSYCARPDLGLFVVADGMGGHAAGEVASQTAVETIATVIHETAAADEHPAWPVPPDPGLSVAANQLKAAFAIANRRIADLVTGDARLSGMATTASAVLLNGGQAVLAHVGDSRVYRLRLARLERLTSDHSWVEEQVRAGALSAAMARRHPWRNVVTRALSGGDGLEVNVVVATLEAGDRFLLCSDGLVAVLGDEGIERLLGLADPLQQVCDALVDEANRGGGPDNVTVLALQVDAA